MSKVMESRTTFGEPTVVISLWFNFTTLYSAVKPYNPHGDGTWYTDFSEALAEARESWEFEVRSYTRNCRGLDTARAMQAEIDRLHEIRWKLLV